MKTIHVRLTLILAFCMYIVPTFAQDTYNEAIIGIWEIQGTLMGDDGSGWLMPHKHTSDDCKDHTAFAEDLTAKEVKHNSNCEANERIFGWKLDGNVLTLTKDERSIKWHIKSIEDGKMTVGVQVRPDSENRMYVVFEKRN